MVKTVTIPFEMYQEMLCVLPRDRQLEIEAEASVMIQMEKPAQKQRQEVALDQERATFGQKIYLPGKGPRRESGSLGRFG